MFTLSQSAGAEIYKWVDENGVVHFSDTPPPGKEAEKLQGRPIDKIGVTEPVSTPGSNKVPSTSQDLEDRIQYYEEEISRNEKEIKDYEKKIEELENSKRNFPTHRMGPSQKKYYTDLGKQFDSDIERYRGLIDNTKKKIVEYRSKITILQGELAISQLTPERQEAPEQKTPEQKPPKAILYHGDIEIHVFHQPGCSYYNCESCIAVFNTRAEALSAGYQPCNICNP